MVTIQFFPFGKRTKNMFKFTNLLLLLLSIVLFTSCSKNMKVDDTEGLANIDKEIKSLIGENSKIIDLALSSSVTSSKLIKMTLKAYDPENKQVIHIKYNLSDDKLEKDIDDYPSSRTNKKSDTLNKSVSEEYPVPDNPALTDFLTYIEECKSMIPEGYEYSHTSYISFGSGTVTCMDVILNISDKEKAKRHSFIKKKYYTYYKTTYGRRGRITGKRAIKEEYYTMRFLIRDNKVEIR